MIFLERLLNMSKLKLSEIPLCDYPNCKNRKAAKARRGESSPLYSTDQSKRWHFCRPHQKGKLKQQRLDWQASKKA